MSHPTDRRILIYDHASLLLEHAFGREAVLEHDSGFYICDGSDTYVVYYCGLHKRGVTRSPQLRKTNIGNAMVLRSAFLNASRRVALAACGQVGGIETAV
jgi:hypothetical protein